MKIYSVLKVLGNEVEESYTLTTEGVHKIEQTILQGVVCVYVYYENGDSICILNPDRIEYMRDDEKSFWDDQLETLETNKIAFSGGRYEHYKRKIKERLEALNDGSNMG